MRFSVILLVLFLAATFPALARQNETIEQLKMRAEAARIEDRTALYTEIAQREVDSADQLFEDGKNDVAQEAVKEVVTYSEKATDASTHTGKRLKQTEIGVRRMAARLRDIKRTLPFEEQPPLQTAVNRLEELRTSLLTRMFGAKKEEKQ